jgi:hypothetical protein
MRRLSLGLESIHFQNDAFFRELALVFTDLKKEKADDLKDSAHAGTLSKVIKNHTKFKVTVELTDFGPAVMVPTLNKNNVLIQDFNREFASSADGIRLIAESSNAAKGTVNLKTGMVSGVFAEMQNTMVFPLSMLKGNKFTPQECAAAVLHEIGHLFTYCEYMSRTVSTNQALAGLHKALLNAGTPDEREMILISVKQAMKLDELDPTELAKEKNNSVVEMVVVSNVVSKTESELGTNIYDLNTWEYLSDQYATRMGAGKDLVSVLDKIYRSSGNISFRSTAGYLGMEALKATLIIMSIVSIVTPVGFLARAGLSVGWILIVMDGMGDGTYDRPGVRLKRIRNQIVEAMKDKKLKTDYAQQLTEDLQAIDEVLAQINDREQLAGKIWNLFSANSRRRLSQEALAKELEGIASNDLFVQSLKLRQIATA